MNKWLSEAPTASGRRTRRKEHLIKKAIAGIFAAGAVAMMVVLGGCGGAQQAAPAPAEPTAQEQTVQAQAPEATAQEEAAATEAPAATSAPAATETQATASAPAATQQQSPYIGEDAAKRIAFDDAGVAEQDTSRLRVELDTDDGVTKYEVDFHVSQMEYEYDIDPVTGAILERSAEIDD